MNSENQIVNKVATSGLITFDLEDYYSKGERVLIDIKDQLEKGLILREKNFRDFIRKHNWQQYKNKYVAIICSSDAIIPNWAYMLLASALQPFARKVCMGDLKRLEEELFQDALAKIDWESFKGKKVVLKGCSKVDVPSSVYVQVTNHLRPWVSSLMYGEPCSTVPVFKAKNLSTGTD